MSRQILIIEDDPVSRRILQVTLSQAGWEVLEASDGYTGLDMVEENRPAAVIIDLHIPGLNGFHVCRRIRENPQMAKVKLIITSISRYPGDARTALESGADHFLIKPIHPRQILELLPRLPAGDQVRDVRSRQVTRSPFAAASTQLRFWGVRGSIPVPGPETVRYGGNTTCIEIRVGQDILIVDGGTGIRLLGNKLMEEAGQDPQEINLLITHTHWDHIQGLPFFTPAYVHPNRIHVYGFSGAVQSLRLTVLEQMKSVYFPVNPSDLAVVAFHELKEMNFAINDIPVRTLFTNHPGICLAYRMQTPHGVIVCLADHEVYEAQYRNLKNVRDEEIHYAREQDAKVIEFIYGADILVADAQFDTLEYSKRVGWGHSCLDDVLRMAQAGEVGRLVFTHHAPEHSDAQIDAMEAKARHWLQEMKSPMQVNAAAEGAAFVLE